MKQPVSLAPEKAGIVAGTEIFQLTGWLGGYAGQDDNVVVKIVFVDGSGSSVGQSQIGPVLNAARRGVTGLVYRFSTGSVPVSAVYVEAIVTTTRVSGSYDDGYADDISLEMHTG